MKMTTIRVYCACLVFLFGLVASDVQDDLNQLVKNFAGKFDNIAQYENDKQKPLAERHLHLITTSTPEQVPVLVGFHCFYVEQYLNGNISNIIRQRLYAYGMDEQTNQVVLKLYSFLNPDSYRHASPDSPIFSSLSMDDLVYATGCDVYWTRVSDNYFRSHMFNTCLVNIGGAEVLIIDRNNLTDNYLTADETWVFYKNHSVLKVYPSPYNMTKFPLTHTPHSQVKYQKHQQMELKQQLNQHQKVDLKQHQKVDLKHQKQHQKVDLKHKLKQHQKEMKPQNVKQHQEKRPHQPNHKQFGSPNSVQLTSFDLIATALSSGQEVRYFVSPENCQSNKPIGKTLIQGGYIDSFEYFFDPVFGPQRYFGFSTYNLALNKSGEVVYVLKEGFMYEKDGLRLRITHLSADLSTVVDIIQINCSFSALGTNVQFYSSGKQLSPISTTSDLYSVLQHGGNVRFSANYTGCTGINVGALSGGVVQDFDYITESQEVRVTQSKVITNYQGPGYVRDIVIGHFFGNNSVTFYASDVTVDTLLPVYRENIYCDLSAVRDGTVNLYQIP